jgi:hypothetical protein
MLEKDLIVLDIKKNFSTYEKLWAECNSYVKNNCQTDPLYENYLSINLDDFLNFSIAVYDDRIISFGGLEQKKDRWSDHIVRALTRFWIHPDHRTKGLTKWDDTKIRFSPIILKSQLQHFYDQNTRPAIMITREGKYINSFREIIRLANSVSQEQFTILDGRFNVCKPQNPPPKTCVQYVAITDTNIFYRSQQQGFLQKYE